MTFPASSASPRRVFVSSVIEGFESFREAARQGILAADGDPILVNEDFPSLAASSRNACLDAIDSADYFVLLIGSRGGWTAPSGKLVVEEEYERAVARKQPILVFLQDVPRDDHAARLVRRVSDYVEGAFRRTFTNELELQRELERALHPLLTNPESRLTMPKSSEDDFAKPYAVQGMTMLRFVLMPERQEEVVDPVRISSEQFGRRVYEIAHSADVGILSFERPKTRTLERDDLVILQTDNDGRNGARQYARIQISESGRLVIDANISGRAQQGDSFFSAMVIDTRDIEAVLEQCHQFSAALYDEIDPFKRHQRFGYDVCLSGLDHRRLERNPQPRSSFGMNMQGTQVIRAFGDWRAIARADLRQPAPEIERAVVLLERRANE
ncbi:MAG: hypothetical protein JWM95_2901 [Gemmatimonadetes bacterium]|nr:hypothetical protein [Gemmatimonadota bacterium]